MRLTTVSFYVLLGSGLFASDRPTELKVGDGKFSVTDMRLKYADPQAKSTPYFQAILLNETGTEWKDLQLSVSYTDPTGNRASFTADSNGEHVLNGSLVRFVHFFPKPFDFDPAEATDFSLSIRGSRLGKKPILAYKGIVVETDCLDDFGAALATSGLELRKRLIELSKAGCTSVLMSEYEADLTGSTRMVGPQKQEFAKAILHNFSEKPPITDGWILKASVVHSFADEFQEYPPNFRKP